jgi:hypothetical protein
MTIKCTKFRSRVSGSLLGFANIEVEKWSLEIRNIKLFMKNGRRWISMPSYEFTTVDGETKYASYLVFLEPSHMSIFQDKVIEAIDRFCAHTPEGNSVFDSEQKGSQ